MKICSSCKKPTSTLLFYKDKRRSDGLKSQCKECHKKSIKEYKKTDGYKQYKKEYSKKYRSTEPHKKYSRKYSLLESTRVRKREFMKKYRKTVKYKDYIKRRLSTDINYKLAKLLRNRLTVAIRGDYRGGEAVRNLGCKIEDLRLHLEKQFSPGMTWGNHGINGWHIDHIKPLSKFDLLDKGQLLEACNYMNLQPLWSAENRAKSNKFVLPCHGVGQ